MMLSLLINILIDTEARPTRAYRILAWTVDAIVAAAIIGVVANGLSFWINHVVPAITYAFHG